MHQLHPNQACTWKRQAVAGMADMSARECRDRGSLALTKEEDMFAGIDVAADRVLVLVLLRLGRPGAGALPVQDVKVA